MLSNLLSESFSSLRSWFTENSKMFQLLLNSTTANISFHYTADRMEFSRCLQDVSFGALGFANQELDFTNPGAEGEKNIKYNRILMNLNLWQPLQQPE